jgi:DNA-binding NarL/FixJ family response regulator
MQIAQWSTEMTETMQPPEVIKVAIIEDRREIREGLAMLIGGTPGYSCTGSYRSMEDALPRIAVPDLPHVALCDIGLPGMSGIEGMRILKERFPNLLLLMLTVYDDDERIFDALCAGACGYLLKKTPPLRLLESLKEVVTGGSPMSPEVARRVIALFRDIRPPERADYELTPHETRLLKLLVEGHNYKTAALELKVSVNTVSFHMRHIYEKLQVHSKSEAVAKALRDRLVQ